MAEPMILEVLSNLKSRVATNETNISTNAANIETNKGLFDTHTADDNRHWTTADRQNFDRVVHFKGYFTTEAKLKEAHPTANVGDYAIVGATDTVWAWDDTNNKWLNTTEQGVVISVNGATGEVVLDKTSVGLGNVDNTSDANKPVSTAQQTALDNKVDRLTATDAQINGTTLRTGIYIWTGVLPNGDTEQKSHQWTVVVGEKSDKSSVSQLWISANDTGVNELYIRTHNGTKWGDFEQIALGGNLGKLEEEFKNLTEYFDKLYESRAYKGDLENYSIDNFVLDSGLYCYPFEHTINDFTSENWSIAVFASNAYTDPDLHIMTVISQIWIGQNEDGKIKMFTRTSVPDSGVWSSFVEIRTSEDIDDNTLIRIKNYKGYFATGEALATAHPIGVSGDYAIVDTSFYVWDATHTAWAKVSGGGGGTGAVSSVNGLTGDVILTKNNIGLTNVDNTADADKNVATAKKWESPVLINGMQVDGSNITVYDYCEAQSTTKTVSGETRTVWKATNTSFRDRAISVGQVLSVKFPEDIEGNPVYFTINNIGESPIFYKESSSLTGNHKIKANVVYQIVFGILNGNFVWRIIGDIEDYSEPTEILQTYTEEEDKLRVLLSGTNDDETKNDTITKNDNFIAVPSTGEFYAKRYVINKEAAIRYDENLQQIIFEIGDETVATISVDGVFTANKLVETNGEEPDEYISAKEQSTFQEVKFPKVVELPYVYEYSAQFSYVPADGGYALLNVNFSKDYLTISHMQTGFNIRYDSYDGIHYNLIQPSSVPEDYFLYDVGMPVQFRGVSQPWTDLLGYFFKVKPM